MATNSETNEPNHLPYSAQNWPFPFPIPNHKYFFTDDVPETEELPLCAFCVSETAEFSDECACCDRGFCKNCTENDHPSKCRNCGKFCCEECVEASRCEECGTEVCATCTQNEEACPTCSGVSTSQVDAPSVEETEVNNHRGVDEAED